MAKYTAYFTTTASMTLVAEVPDDVAAEGPEEISEWIMSNSRSATLCAQCSGWGQPYSLDLAEWEPETHGEGERKGLAYVTDADGGEVLGERASDG
jgi:hypothetical protein